MAVADPVVDPAYLALPIADPNPIVDPPNANAYLVTGPA